MLPALDIQLGHKLKLKLECLADVTSRGGGGGGGVGGWFCQS